MSSTNAMPLIKLAGGYEIGSGLKRDTCFGPVLATPWAFILVIAKKLTMANMAGAVMGGAIGFAFGEALSGGQGQQVRNAGASVWIGSVRELPTSVRGNAAWPQGFFDKQAIVIPKEAVTQIKYNFWTYFSIHTAEQVFQIRMSLFGRSRILKQLREMGWSF